MKNILALVFVIPVLFKGDIQTINKWAMFNNIHIESIEKMGANHGPFLQNAPGNYYKVVGQTECYVSEVIWVKAFDGFEFKVTEYGINQN